jgi:predicted transcriptional regulator
MIPSRRGYENGMINPNKYYKLSDCYEDVVKEIKKTKRYKIQSILIDIQLFFYKLKGKIKWN